MKRSLAELDEKTLDELKVMKAKLKMKRITDVVEHLLEFHKTHKTLKRPMEEDSTKTHKTQRFSMGKEGSKTHKTLSLSKQKVEKSYTFSNEKDKKVEKSYINADEPDVWECLKPKKTKKEKQEEERYKEIDEQFNTTGQ